VIDLGRARARLRGEAEAPRRSRLAETLRVAEGMQAALEAGGVNRAGLARTHGVTRARVTQVLALLELEPEIRAWLSGPGLVVGLSERKLRPILRLDRREQLQMMRRICPAFAPPSRARA
jgi:hypothetical protein